MKRQLQIGIIGSAGQDDYQKGVGASANAIKQAEQLGYLCAKTGAIVVTGGKSGIMEAAARGAKKAGGTTVGVVKGTKRNTSNRFTDIEIISGMQADGFDEFLLVMMCDALIAIGGGAGTLEEITIAYRNNKPIIAITSEKGWSKKCANTFLDSRQATKILAAKTPQEAVDKLHKLL